MIRICIITDWPTDDPTVAYRELQREMKKTTIPLGWETSDEWFNEDGRLIPLCDKQKAFNTVFRENQRQVPPGGWQ